MFEKVQSFVVWFLILEYEIKWRLGAQIVF